MDLKDLLKRLKEILEKERGCDVHIEILSSSPDDIKKIKSFVALSGCQAAAEEAAEEKEGYYLVLVTGSPCCA
jgi:hypothetical protein